MRLVWACTAEQGTEDEFALGWVRQQDADGYAWSAIAGSRCDDECAEIRCPFYERCYFFGALRVAQQADVVVVNQSLLLSSSRALKTCRHVVIDEAHTLERAATEALTARKGKAAKGSGCAWRGRLRSRAAKASQGT
jgi:Rad3-related DNA helicase